MCCNQYLRSNMLCNISYAVRKEINDDLFLRVEKTTFIACLVNWYLIDCARSTVHRLNFTIDFILPIPNIITVIEFFATIDLCLLCAATLLVSFTFSFRASTDCHRLVIKIVYFLYWLQLLQIYMDGAASDT